MHVGERDARGFERQVAVVPICPVADICVWHRVARFILDLEGHVNRVQHQVLVGVLGDFKTAPVDIDVLEYIFVGCGRVAIVVGVNAWGPVQLKLVRTDVHFRPGEVAILIRVEPLIPAVAVEPDSSLIGHRTVRVFQRTGECTGGHLFHQHDVPDSGPRNFYIEESGRGEPGPFRRGCHHGIDSVGYGVYGVVAVCRGEPFCNGGA